jgi:hypothetical protein
MRRHSQRSGVECRPSHLRKRISQNLRFGDVLLGDLSLSSRTVLSFSGYGRFAVTEWFEPLESEALPTLTGRCQRDHGSLLKSLIAKQWHFSSNHRTLKGKLALEYCPSNSGAKQVKEPTRVAQERSSRGT